MNINKIEIHQEQVSVFMKQEEIEELIINHISEQSGLKVDKSTVKNIFFRQEDCGSAGFRTSARIELTNNLNQTAQP